MSQSIQELLQTGLGHYRAGEQRDAEACFREVLQCDPDCIPALNLLGMLYVNGGRAAEAKPLIERALQLKPEDHQAHANLGLANQRTGDLQNAEKHFIQSLKLNPDNPAILQSLGTVLAERARYTDAIRRFEQSLRLHHNNPQCWVSLSQALVEQGRPERAIQAAREALKLDPKMPDALYQVAEVYRKASRFEQAVDAYQKLLQLHPGFLDAALGLAVTYRQMEDPESALAQLEETIASHPRFAPAHSALGVLQEQLGNRDAAAECFKQAIALAPRAIKPHCQLAQLKGRKSSNDEIAAMEDLRRRGGLPAEEMSELCFGLGEAFYQREARVEAFEAWSEANGIRAQRCPYDHMSRITQRDEILRLTRKMLQQPLNRERQISGPRMVFIVGMPRSGTSLTDQVLSAHASVVSLGEVSYSEDMSRQVKRLTGKPYPAGLPDMTEQHLDTLRDSYLARLPESASSAGIVLDKTPMNFQYLGLLACVFPDAQFIHCHRHPVDNCFSIYRLPFSTDQDYAHDLVALGQHYQLYWEMMRQWKELYPQRVLDVCYEHTVTDLKAQAERLATFLDIPFVPAMLEFHRVERLVRTPSASQVRQPIYRTAVQAWRDYEAQLQPLVEALGELVLSR